MNPPEHFEIREAHAVFRPIGQVSLDQGVKMVTAAIAFAREQNIRKLLAITTGLTGFEPPTIPARYFFVKEWAEASRGAVHLAVVARPEMIHPEKFGVLVAINSGLIADVFTSEDEALAWLQGIE